MEDVPSRSLRIHQDFPALIRGFDIDALESDAHSACALSTDLSFLYFNPAWFRFARANGGEAIDSPRYGLGASFVDVLPEVVRNDYVAAYRGVLDTGQPWHHDYECSGPDLFRRYHQTVYRFHNGQGLLVVNSLREAHRPISDFRMPQAPAQGTYRSTITGLITQCCNCRRVQRIVAPYQWDWVPAWVKAMPCNTTSGLCEFCNQYYWRRRQG
ncbi:MAG: hypothetical protein ACNA7W_05390 [Pseudomonadales bacterium]